MEEGFRHVVERITSIWPSSECLRYLEALLLDDMTGTRREFSLQVAEEIELLHDVIRARLGEERSLQGKAAGRADPAPSDATPPSARVSHQGSSR